MLPASMSNPPVRRRDRLYRIYDNEWWHFEYRPEGRPPRLPDPGASLESIASITSEPCTVRGDQP